MILEPTKERINYAKNELDRYSLKDDAPEEDIEKVSPSPEEVLPDDLPF